MRRVLRRGAEEVQVVQGSLIDFRSEREVMAYLRRYTDDGANALMLRGLLTDTYGQAGVSRMTDEEVFRRVAQQVAQGRVKLLIRNDRPRVAVGRKSTPEPEQLDLVEVIEEILEETTWVSLELLDERGEPYGGADYWVRTSSGKTIKGKLDSDGKAKVMGVDPGSCKVTFPRLDAADWDKA